MIWVAWVLVVSHKAYMFYLRRYKVRRTCSFHVGHLHFTVSFSLPPGKGHLTMGGLLWTAAQSIVVR